MGYIIINKAGKPLSAFKPSNLPVGTSGKYSPRPVFCFRTGIHSVFGSEALAADYARFMFRELRNNRERYEEALEGSADRLENFFRTLTITEENL